MPLISLPIYLHIPAFSTLIDSGSSHCFIDSRFVTKHNIPTYSVPLLQLCLFDGTSNSVIMQGVDLSIHFSTSEIISVALFATPLDSTCFLVLGHNWLTCYNPSIDWALGSINFCSTSQEMPSTCYKPSMIFHRIPFLSSYVLISRLPLLVILVRAHCSLPINSRLVL